MGEKRGMKYIARIHTDFPEKFGIPRQSGLAEELEGLVVFEPEYRTMNAVRGLSEFSHIWLLWEFSEAVREEWSPTVRPPRLGGNTRMGVFATRSPFRPNPIGLSAVRLLAVEEDEKLGPVLRVAGADLMDGTGIYDVKPYLPYADAIPDASGGFAERVMGHRLRVVIPEEWSRKVPGGKLAALVHVLEMDPRPGYQREDAGRVYGMRFAGVNVRFRVEDGVLVVCEVEGEAAHSARTGGRS